LGVYLDKHFGSALFPGFFTHMKEVLEFNILVFKALKNQMGRHDFGHGRRNHELIRIFFKQNRSRIKIHHVGLSGVHFNGFGRERSKPRLNLRV
jgi:hypothetical protein